MPTSPEPGAPDTVPRARSGSPDGPSASGSSEFVRPKARPLALNSSAVFAISVVIQLIGYVPTFLFAQLIGVNDAGKALLGTIQFFLLLATSVTNLADLRIGSAYTFYISRGEPPTTSTGTYLLLRLGMVGVAGLALWALAPTIGLSGGATVAIFAVWMVLPVLWSFSTVYQQAWIALGDSLKSQLPLLIESVVRAGALSYVALRVVTLSGSETDPASVLWSMTDAYVIGAAASASFTLPSLLRLRGPFRWSGARRMFRWSWPLMGSMVLLYLSGNLISLVIYPVLGATPYNIFNAANAFRILALALPVAIALPLFPHIAALHKAAEFELVRARTWQAIRFTSMLVVPGVIALVAYRSNLINTFYQGSYIYRGNIALAILAVSAIPAALSQIIGTTMTSIGKTRLELYVTSAQVATLGLLAALLFGAVPGVPPLSRIGATSLDQEAFAIDAAALAVLGSSLAAMLLNAYFMAKLIGVRIQLRPIGTILLSSVAAFFAISRINHLLPINRYYQLAAGVLLGFAVYLVVLALIGELSKQDVLQITSSLGLPLAVGVSLSRLCWRRDAPGVNPLPPGSGGALVPLPEETGREGDGPEPGNGPGRPR